MFRVSLILLGLLTTTVTAQRAATQTVERVSEAFPPDPSRQARARDPQARIAVAFITNRETVSEIQADGTTNTTLSIYFEIPQPLGDLRDTLHLIPTNSARTVISNAVASRSGQLLRGVGKEGQTREVIAP